MLPVGDRESELPLEYASSARPLALELVDAIKAWVDADGSPDAIDVVRMLELAVLFYESGDHFWCGAAIELADAGVGIGQSEKCALLAANSVTPTTD